MIRYRLCYERLNSGGVMKLVSLSLGCASLALAACSLDPRIDASGMNSPAAAAAAAGSAYGNPYVANGAAAYPCAFDTRTMVEMQGHFIEVITSRGWLFEFESGMPMQTPVAPQAPAYVY